MFRSNQDKNKAKNRKCYSVQVFPSWLNIAMRGTYRQSYQMGSIPSSYKDLRLVCTFKYIFNLLYEKRYTEFTKT